jgi:cyclopropane fatty-acyl-phospholipid synthase-like methyltransferase
MKHTAAAENLLINARENDLESKEVLKQNKKYWDATADEWFGVTSLPTLGCLIPSEEDLQLFGDVTGKKILDIGCGSGHSLKYHADHNAAELWGLDISTQQIKNATRYLKDCGYEAHLFDRPMEEDIGLHNDYFDIIYSIYAIGWTTDLQKTFNLAASYLKQDGIFIFSWDHPVMRCMEVKENKLVFEGCYYDENIVTYKKDGYDVSYSKRKISTYINALSKAGFAIEEMIEETDKQTLESECEITQKYYSPFKAKKFPLSFVIKARKL